MEKWGKSQQKYDNFPSWLSVAVINTMTNSSLGEEGSLPLCFRVQSTFERTRQQSLQEGTWRQEPCGDAAYLLASSDNSGLCQADS